MKVICFGVAKEITGASAIEVAVEDAPDVLSLKRILLQKYPGFIDLSSLRVAVDEAYAEDDQALNPESEVVLIPPVSGG